MSAECSKHGTDIVYPEGTWPVGVCSDCERDDLREENTKLRAAIDDALGRYQVTHIHAALREALK